MKKQWKRLVAAALISSSVFAVTWYWYQFSSGQFTRRTNEKPLAYVGKVVDDIQRRPASRLLWQLVGSGEPLYNGEAIRTSERGEVRIQFADSDRYLDLEPDSLIVIKKSEGEIALDLMEGSLFVNAKSGDNEESAPNLVLNSAKGKVDLSQASANLSVNKGATVDVQVLEGKASIKSGDGKSNDLKSKSEVRILSPLPQKPIAMNAESPEPILFQWDGFPANTAVSVWAGPSRKQMKEIAKAGANISRTVASLPFGRHYWKLVGTSTKGEVTESIIYKSEIVPRFAPTMIFPTAGAEIPANKIPYDLTFKWQKGDDTSKLILEIWSDPLMQNKITSKSFSAEESFTVPNLQPGTYFWRLSSFFVDSTKPLEGKVQKLVIKAPEQVTVKAPEPPKPVIPVAVEFTMGPSDMTQYYLEKPQVGISWKAQNAEQVASWRVKLHEQSSDPAFAETIEVKETKLAKQVTKPGRYIASIEALDKEGKVLGNGTSQALTVAPLPLIKAPKITSAEGIIEADMNGRTQLEWSKVEGAKEYWLTISKDGKELKKTKFMGTSTALSNLLPGNYQIQISAIDTYGRSSETATPRTLQVPNKSNVKAPTLKKIKVN